MNTRKIIYAIALCFGVVLCLETCSTTQPIDWPEGDVVFIAHRGIVPGYPENTIAAFRQAIKYGVDAIEIDLRGTKDGKIVIIHDEMLTLLCCIVSSTIPTRDDEENLHADATYVSVIIAISFFCNIL